MAALGQTEILRDMMTHFACVSALKCWYYSSQIYCSLMNGEDDE